MKFMDFIKEHKVGLCIGTGISLSVAAVVTAIKGTIKACRLFEEIDSEKTEPLTKKEWIKDVLLPSYWPTLLLEGGSIFSFIMAAKSHGEVTATLTSAFAQELARNERLHESLSMLPEGQREEVYSKYLDEYGNPETDIHAVKTCRGDDIFYDTFTGQMFTSNEEFIIRTMNELNRQITTSFDDCSFADWQLALDLEPTAIMSEFIWNADNGLIKIDLSHTAKKNGHSVTLIRYITKPKYRRR